MNDDRHVTRLELSLELKSFRNEVRLILVGMLVVLKFDVPENVTVGALVLAGLVAAGKGLLARFSSS